MGSTPHLMRYASRTVSTGSILMHTGGHSAVSALGENGASYPFRVRHPMAVLAGTCLGGLMIAVGKHASRDAADEGALQATMDPIRLLVVDDHAAVRRGLRELLQDQPDFRVIDVVSSAEGAMSVAEREELDVRGL
jgi:hypothetical protein